MDNAKTLLRQGIEHGKSLATGLQDTVRDAYGPWDSSDTIPSKLIVNYINAKGEPGAHMPSINLTIDRAQAQRTLKFYEIKHKGEVPRGANAVLLTVLAVMTDGDYTSDFLKPTPYSIRKLWLLIEDSVVAGVNNYPPGEAYPDGDGGMCVEWSTDTGRVLVSVPRDEYLEQSLYSKIGDNASSLRFSPTGNDIAAALSEL